MANSKLGFEELCELVEAMQASDSFLRGMQQQGTLPVFLAGQALSWLQANGYQESSTALATLQQLAASNLLVPAPGTGTFTAGIREESMLAFTCDLPTVAQGRPLNTAFEWQGPARAAPEVSEGMRRKLLSLYGQYVDEDGKMVDYVAMARDPGFRTYCVMAAELQKVDVSGLTREQRLAFFINCYNSLVIHANTVIPPAKNLLGRLKFFDIIKYNIGGIDYSANDLEHGMLRDNAVSPTSLGALIGRPGWSLLAPKWLKQGDPRLPLRVSPKDPRIHFALNCGAVSCPAIRVYNERNIGVGLAGAARAFVKGEVTLLPEQSEVLLSKIFKWYKGDFGSTDEDLLRYILEYMDDERKPVLQGMLDGGKKVKLTFKEYDWSTNAKSSASR